MTWLGYLNYYFFQWFFIRIARIMNDSNEQIGWTIIKVYPGTGWGERPYRFWGKRKSWSR